VHNGLPARFDVKLLVVLVLAVAVEVDGDFGAAVALLSYIALPLILFVELPLLIMRASLEDKMLAKHFGDEFMRYKKNSGFMIPFIG